MTRSRLAGVLVGLWVLLASRASVVAEDAPAPQTFADLKACYEAARKEKDWDKVGELIPKLATAAKEGKVEDEIKEAISIFNRHLTYGSQGLQVASLDGFGLLAKPTSSQYLRSFVDGDKAGKRPFPVRIAALEAWAKIHDPGTHEVLLNPLFAYSTDDQVRDMAVQAAKQYVHYGEVPKRHRFLVVRDFMQAYQRIYDQTFLSVGTGTQGWWALLSPPMLATFNSLTGTEQRSFEDCARWWRENRGKVQADRD